MPAEICPSASPAAYHIYETTIHRVPFETIGSHLQ
jgi:hypothetical protein